MIKAVFLDIDGTLIAHEQGGVPESAGTALEEIRRRGVLVFASTGRHILELKKLPLENVTFDGYVTLTGQICLDGDENLICETAIEKEDVDRMLHIFNQCETPVVIVEKGRMYINFVNDHVRRVQKAISSPVPVVGIYTGNTIYQFVIYARKKEALEIAGNLGGCVITSWNPEAVDVTSKKAGKARGIRRMIEKYGIRQDEIMAFGDGENDIDMIEFAGIGVAMGNAEEEVKRRADYVTDDVNKDGLRKAFEHFGLL
ncbi:MAG TPA: Cof-type HAD-IIB family hydrolase [Candidatus Mediterraneibacter norfolkensis]|nr:Cof-type HAD-IIB family hydrolase [Candidatus Mediterraneibacter norfolkensis]